MEKPNIISEPFELETSYSIIFEGRAIELPNPKDLTENELADMVLDIWEHPDKYRRVSITESSGLLDLMEEEGSFYSSSSFTPERNPYTSELRERLYH